MKKYEAKIIYEEKHNARYLQVDWEKLPSKAWLMVLRHLLDEFLWRKARKT